MEMRKLQATDLFSMVRILNLIGFKTIRESIDFNKIMEAKKTITEENADEVIKSLGADIVIPIVEVLLENLPKIENDLYKLLASLTGTKDKDIAKLGINDFMDLLIALIKKEEFVDFFKRASKLIK